MAFIECSFQDFKNRVREGKKEIICYGAGMLPLYSEQLLLKQGLLQKICLFLDSNQQKKGQKILYQDREIPVEAPEALGSLSAEKHIILITAEKYKEILHVLEKYIRPEEWECYAYPLLNLSYFESMERRPLVMNARQSIPKVLHYTWFGRNGKKELHRKCIESWKRYCPDYTILEWNEDNYNVYKNKYIGQAYEHGKWAYVSDYARLDILHEYGGIYFDTDVELTGSIDGLLHTEAFICFGEWPAPNSGAGVGCVKENAIIKEMMEERETISFIRKDGSGDSQTNSNYEMRVLRRHGFQMDFTYQNRGGFAMLPPDIIAPASVAGRDAFVTERTVGLHYCNNSWREA